jgi:hypothetical protein
MKTTDFYPPHPHTARAQTPCEAPRRQATPSQQHRFEKMLCQPTPSQDQPAHNVRSSHPKKLESLCKHKRAETGAEHESQAEGMPAFLSVNSLFSSQAEFKNQTLLNEPVAADGNERYLITELRPQDTTLEQTAVLTTPVPSRLYSHMALPLAVHPGRHHFDVLGPAQTLLSHIQIISHQQGIIDVAIQANGHENATVLTHHLAKLDRRLAPKIRTHLRIEERADSSEPSA